MATMTIEYDGRNTAIKQLINSLLSVGIIRKKKETIPCNYTLEEAKKIVKKRICDAKKGKGVLLDELKIHTEELV